MSRYYNYLVNNNEFVEGFTTVRKIIRDIEEYDVSILDDIDKEYILSIREEIEEYKNYLGDKPYDIRQLITNDLISPEVVNYYYEYKKYPEKPSPTGERINKIFNRIFEIEDKIQMINAKVWNRLLTPFDKLENGKPFSIVGHSGGGYIITPQSKYYRNNSYNNVHSYSCSLFNDKSINVFSSNLVMIFDLDEANYISACNFDCATRKVQDNLKTVTLLQEIDGQGVSAGYLNNTDIDMAITKSECPTSIINKINNSNQINEFLINKKTSIPKGLVIFSNGYDCPIVDYYFAREMMNDYNLDLKVINKSLYINDNKSREEKIEELHSYMDSVLSNLNKPLTREFLDNFIDDVVIPLKLDKEIEDIIINKINTYKQENTFTY